MASESRKVSVLLDCSGHIVCAYESEEMAYEKADKFNSDPMLDSETADAGVPYTVETILVRGEL